MLNEISRYINAYDSNKLSIKTQYKYVAELYNYISAEIHNLYCLCPKNKIESRNKLVKIIINKANELEKLIKPSNPNAELLSTALTNFQKEITRLTTPIVFKVYA